MRLFELVSTSRAVTATASRTAKVSALATCIAQLPASELAIGVALLSGQARQGRVGIGPRVAHALNVSPADQPTLTLIDVDQRLTQLDHDQGAGVGKRRDDLLRDLFARATDVEQSFLRRLLVGELRQGALEGVMLDAIAKAFDVEAALVRRALMLTGDLTRAAMTAQAGGANALNDLRLALFTPLSPMLAQSAADAAEALEVLVQPAFEWKLDGARIQVHRRGDELRVYSRQLNDVTAAVPEIVEAARGFAASAFVLDGEAIAMRSDGRPESFQTTMRRFGRKLDVERLRTQLPLSAFYFDVLHLDGDDLLDVPASERAAALERAVPAAMRVERVVSDDLGTVNGFIERALHLGHEGVVAKSLTAPYQAGRRNAAWLKIKRAHTLDLVVLAVEWGSGRREGYLSNLHLGARDTDGSFVMVGKTFKGMTDAMLAFQTQRLLALETRRDSTTVYVRPELVVEVAFDGVQVSPRYAGGAALRFARVKGYREDKRADEADTIATVRAAGGLSARASRAADAEGERR